MNKGRLVVFEGTDGSGKTTQAELLLKYLRKNKIPNAYISFPRYEESMWGKMVRRFLNGEFGKIGEVDPYFASMLYAGDRASAAPKIRRWLSEGKVVVCNRYVGSNIGHMAAKFRKADDRQKYTDWLENLEYKENGIPKEDVVVLLQVPPIVSRRLMKDRKLDIHEKDQKYQEEVYWAYDFVAGLKKHWIKVDCTGGGKILDPDEIHQKVLGALAKRKIIK
ncbi:MAG: thymidylate kinase [Candidatus Curtissbacteria bacterium]